MILPGENYPAIDVYKLAQFIVRKAEGETTTIGEFQLVDVGDKEDFIKQHIIGAEHYDIARLSRNYFETELLDRVKKSGKTMIIYGHGADRATSSLGQRGYKTILLIGSIKSFKQAFPDGLLYPKSSSFNIVTLKEVLERKANAKRGERLWRSTSATRTRSVDARTMRTRQQTPTRQKKPWK